MSCDGERCITCGDEGIPMTVVEIGDEDVVCADPDQVRHTVAADLVEPVAVGQELLVHAGVAIRNLSA